MNRQEFDELRSEFAEYIYRYEYFLKCGYLNDLYYNRVFRSDLETNALLEFENSVIYTACQEKEKNKDFDPAELFVIATKNKQDLMSSIEAKKEKSDRIVDSIEKLPLEERQAMENEYLKIVKLYHPVIRVFVTEEEKSVFNKIRQFYNENNANGIREIFELNKELFKPIDYQPEQYTKVSAFFYDNQKRINADYTKKSKEYPFNLGDTLKDEITRARETGELRTKHTQLLRDNQELKKAYKNLYGQDFKF